MIVDVIVVSEGSAEVQTETILFRIGGESGE